jgi:shikimate dehydrogenase
LGGVPYAEVIGDPVAHSKSPVIHGFWLEKLGIEAEYHKTHVRAGNLADFIRQRRADPRWRGCNVTVPHKVAVAALVDHLDGSAATVGAVNCVTSDGTGYNSDVSGILIPLRSAGFVGGHAALIGTGGAARAALAAFDLLSVARVTVVARDVEKAQMLLGARAGAALELRVPLPAADLVFNATSLGMVGQPPLDIDLASLPASALVFDAVYAPLETGLLRRARARGLRTIDGLEMLVGQAAAAFELFFGHPAPRQHDAELRAVLTR